MLFDSFLFDIGAILRQINRLLDTPEQHFRHWKKDCEKPRSACLWGAWGTLRKRGDGVKVIIAIQHVPLA